MSDGEELSGGNGSWICLDFESPVLDAHTESQERRRYVDNLYTQISAPPDVYAVYLRRAAGTEFMKLCTCVEKPQHTA